AEVADRLAGGEAAGEDAIAAVWLLRRAREDLVEVRLPQPPPLAVERVADHGALRDHERRAIELGKVDLRRVIADGMVEGGADDLRGARQLGVRRWIDLDLIELSGRIGHPETRL